jgi:hypothetical protein
VHGRILTLVSGKQRLTAGAHAPSVVFVSPLRNTYLLQQRAPSATAGKFDKYLHFHINLPCPKTYRRKMTIPEPKNIIAYRPDDGGSTDL